MSPNALLPHWQAARQRLDLDAGSVVPNPGSPEILDIPAGNDDALAEVEASLRFQITTKTFHWEIKDVEIAPLLAFQFHVDTLRAESLWLDAGGTTDIRTLLRLCLPTRVDQIQPGVDFEIVRDPTSTGKKGSVTFESGNPNVRLLAAGALGPDDLRRVFLAGAALGEGSRLAQVTRLNGRCYLSNGYHRAFRMAAAGVTHMPCILLDVGDISDTGVASDGTTFDQRLLESQNPPVCAHYAKGYEVTLKSPRRLIKVSWSEQLRVD